MFSVKIKDAKSLFFDRPAVQSAVDRAERSALSRFGAFVRRRARSLIRRRQRASAPGEAPSSHTGLLRDFILFGYDGQRKSVVIGPAKLNAKRGDAPSALEHGGIVSLTVGKQTGERVRIARRPYMQPALEAERPKLADMFRNSVKG
jgi:hypothetical protein